MSWRDKVAKIPPAVREQLRKKYMEKKEREGLTYLDLNEFMMFVEHYSNPNRYSSPEIKPEPPTLPALYARYRLPDTTPQWTSETTKKTPSTK